MIKKLFILTFVILCSLCSIAQTQKGFVKTRGRMEDGKLIPGKGLKGTLVSVHGRNTVLVDNDDGEFSFPIAEDNFRIDSVRKKGYQLVDLEMYSRVYKYSTNPLYFVMESPDQILSDQLTAERTIRRNLQCQLLEKEKELENLKIEQKITEREYLLALEKLYQDQGNNENLIKDMAKRYAELDYDQLDEFYRQVSYSIECGDLVKADSLLATRGDIVEQVESIKQKGKTLQEEKDNLQKAESVYRLDIEEAASRCYSYHETYASRYSYDTAVYYLDLRASLDTTNTEWSDEAGMFAWNYTNDFDKAMQYFQQTLSIRLSENDENNPDVAISYNNIGAVYADIDEDTNAMDCFNKALNIWLSTSGENNPDVALIYNNIGTLYYNQGDYTKALDYYNKALTIRLSLYGENHPDVAQSYYDIGWWYQYHSRGDYKKALSYYKKAETIWQQTLGPGHQNTLKVEKRISEVQKKI